MSVWLNYYRVSALALLLPILFWGANSFAAEEPTVSRARLINFTLDAEPISPLPMRPPVDPDKRELGRTLFFDKRMSDSGDQSCGDCHQLPPIGLEESAKPVLNGELMGKYKRDIGLLYNVSSSFWLNWDGRYAKLERLIEDSVTDTDKFNSSWPELLTKLAPSYQARSNQLYATDLTQAVVIDALTIFLDSLNTPNAPIDRYLRGDKEALSERQRQGYALFKQIGCSSCHNGRAIGTNLFEQLYIYRHDGGAEGKPRLKDLGRYYITGEESDRNSFRVPSLRNIAVTAPYYHDGSVETLEEAVEEMTEHQLGVIPTETQVELLVEFLASLTGFHAGVKPSEGRQ
ncbi:MAG: cytochrome c peroxidase [Halopseudomonas sp.]